MTLLDSENRSMIGAYFCKKNAISKKYLNGAVVIDRYVTQDLAKILVENLQSSCEKAFGESCDHNCDVASLKRKLLEIKNESTSKT